MEFNEEKEFERARDRERGERETYARHGRNGTLSLSRRCSRRSSLVVLSPFCFIYFLLSLGSASLRGKLSRDEIGKRCASSISGPKGGSVVDRGRRGNDTENCWKKRWPDSKEIERTEAKQKAIT